MLHCDVIEAPGHHGIKHHGSVKRYSPTRVARCILQPFVRRYWVQAHLYVAPRRVFQTSTVLRSNIKIHSLVTLLA